MCLFLFIDFTNVLIIVRIRAFFVDSYFHFSLGYALLAVEPTYATDRH